MEGVTDAPMRAFLTELGGFSYCVSEFYRISQDVPSSRSFPSHIPELRTDARTRAGTPVQVQLLGGNPERLAAAAINGVEAGARAIDLNFGCPARTVNQHDGGASLLQHPGRIEAIVRAVRSALPREIPVSAKLRLGPGLTNLQFPTGDDSTVHGTPSPWTPVSCAEKFLAFPPAH